METLEAATKSSGKWVLGTVGRCESLFHLKPHGHKSSNVGWVEHHNHGLGVVEQCVSVDIPPADTPTTPMLRCLADAGGEVSDMRSLALERQSVKQDDVGHPAISSSQPTLEQSSLQHEMTNHLAEISSSQLPMDIGNMQQRNEEPRNNSRHPPLLVNESQDGEFKTGRKFAYWSGSISFSGAMAIIGARAGNLAVNIKKLPFYACSTSMGSAFVISMLRLSGIQQQ